MLEVLPIIVYILLIVLLVVTIILGIKLIGTIDKVNTLVDDVTQKVKTLDKVFELVDLATDRVGMIADVTVNFITSGFKKVFGILNKSKKEETIDE